MIALTDTGDVPAAVAAGTASRPRQTGEAMSVARLAAGDIKAFEALARAHYDRVHALAWRMLGNATDAEDAAQEVLLRLWRNPPDLSDGRAQLSTWLYRVASNLCIDRLRRRAPVGLDEIPEPVDPAPGQEEITDGLRLSERVDAAIGALPERQRLALVLTHFEGLRNTEAAEIMDITVDALESLLSRARRALRHALADDWRAFRGDDVT